MPGRPDAVRCGGQLGKHDGAEPAPQQAAAVETGAVAEADLDAVLPQLLGHVVAQLGVAAEQDGSVAQAGQGAQQARRAQLDGAGARVRAAHRR